MKDFVNNFESFLYNFATPNVGTSKRRLFSPYQIDIKGYNSITVVGNGTSLYIQNQSTIIYAGNNFIIKGNENEIINDPVLNIISIYNDTNVYGIGVIKKKYI
jgi:hypothetical protein